ncbi:glycoside hydrolase 43 family protein [Actinomadura sp. HBU206391]|uniref:glycoside hydrolase family 43 protein n=1 Tax=Actinomadura sp. HBU206391 TaxID=2731692 RepID=UPI00164F3F57|nr:glycoside hydrolase 43 family protein [Actinomadura sp. HBU206391]MBC6458219.1 glycosyl hydrolase 43 family protein [Actinomadura sp. HBU206391]
MTSSLRAAPWTADLGDGTYRNPVLNADWSDPDAIRVGEDFYLVASSFHRVPGLPVLWSRDLVNWTIIGHALGELEPVAWFARPRHGCGIWAPAIRHHEGRFWIFYPDPDHGVFVVTAGDPAGPWSRPHRLKAGLGLIDPCPLWDDDGRAYLVHAWAKSRAGFNNRLTLHRMSPDATRLLDAGTIVVDADLIPGYRTLEGPKLYRHGGWYWIFAPAGGVPTGWQSVFRARDPFGPYEHRVVLAQGDTETNGPHQGAWVTTPSGQDWFLHFQDRGACGRVVHLQPMRWREDGWPVMGADDGTGRGSPVPAHRRPLVPRPGPVCAPAVDDDFSGPGLGPQWSWQANPDPAWWSLSAAGLRLVCRGAGQGGDLRRLPNVLGQRLPAGPCTATVALTLDSTVAGARAGLTVLGETYALIGLERTAGGLALVHRTAPAGEPETDAAARRPLPPGRATAHLAVHITAGAVCRFTADVGDGPEPVGEPVTATAGRWVGATLGLFAVAGTALAGHADFGAFRVTGEARP